MIFILKFSKGYNFVKNVGGVLVLLTSSMKISEKVSELLCGQDFHTKIFKGHNFIKNVG